MGNTWKIHNLLIVCLLFIMACADEDDNGQVNYHRGYVVVEVKKAGALPDLIAANKKYTITKMIISGSLNSRDISFIRDMGGADKYSNKTQGKLSDLDMSGAHIVDDRSYYIPAFFTKQDEIGYKFFDDCESLTHVILPHSVTKIASRAFNDNQSLQSVIIGNNVTEIENHVFSGCTALREVELGANVSAIGKSAFSYCKELSDVRFPDRLQVIGENAFAGCEKLTTILLGKRVSKIEAFAFSECTAVTKIVFPASIKIIEYSAFSDCISVKDIYTASVIPFSISIIAFSGIDKSVCRVHVPPGSVSAYRNHYAWGEFVVITDE